MVTMISEIRAAAGGITAKELAEKLGIARAALYQWKKIPAARCKQIEALTGGKITAEEMRPDIFRAA